MTTGPRPIALQVEILDRQGQRFPANNLTCTQYLQRAESAFGTADPTFARTRLASRRRLMHSIDRAAGAARRRRLPPLFVGFSPQYFMPGLRARLFLLMPSMIDRLEVEILYPA